MQAQDDYASLSSDDISPGQASKKPIPLPRSKLNVDMSSSSSVKSSSSSSKSHSFRKSLKSININDKSKAVLENTKIVGTKLRNVLSRPPKRQSSVFHDEETNTREYDRCQSLPVNDIFNNISFGSPLDIGTQIKHWRGDFNNINSLDEARQSFQNFDDSASEVTSMSESLFDDTMSLPPPDFPPPPLPSDSMDDACSSNSGSYYTVGVIDTESFFEEVIDSVSRRLEDIDLRTSGKPKDKVHSRSDSWNYFNPPPSCDRDGERLQVPEQEVSHSSSEIVSSESTSVVSESCGSFYVSGDDAKKQRRSCVSESSGSTRSHYDNHKLRNRQTSETDSSVSVQETEPCPLPRNLASQLKSQSYENWVPPRPQTIHWYGNWEVSSEKLPGEVSEDFSNTVKNKLVNSQSVIFEFDPLFETLPQPPERHDSICDSTPPCNGGIEEDTKETSLSPEERNVESPSSVKRRVVRWSSMKRAFKNLADNSTNWSATARRGSKAAQETLLSKSDVLDKALCYSSLYNGTLFKSSSNEKTTDMAEKHFQLAEGKLMYANDKGSATKDLFCLESVLSIKRIPDIKQSVQGEDVYCFFVNVLGKAKPFVLGALCTSERRVWMQKILEGCTQNFPTKISSNFIRAGRCYLKEGVTNEWTFGWVVLGERTLLYSLQSNHVIDVDLKKVRSVAFQEGSACSLVSDGSEFILMDTPSLVLYLQMETAQETQTWRHDIKTTATNNGPLLEDQQLTKDEIPTLVDKCIKFVFAHGSMSEGIYRRSGSNSNIGKLLAQFRQDAWAVQLSRSDYTEYDVASVLKRFFRDLPEPLLTTELHKHLCNTAGMDCSSKDKCNIYRSLLEKLPPIHYVTVRKLMGHLYFIQQKKDINRMSVENLASIWGPTLMHVESKDSVEWSKRESQVISDLISFYPNLFLVDEEEMIRERKMLQVLERYHMSSSGSLPNDSKPSGDLKIWIYLGSKESTNCVNVVLDPSKEAGQICADLANRMDMPSYELCLMEVVCEGSLTRFLHHREKVLDVVLEWGYWDDIDCRDNALVLTSNEMLRHEIAPLANHSQAVSGDLKFADRKSKSFKTYLFEFSQSKLSYYKDKKGSVKLGEWKIEDIIWYLGYEKKRNPQTRWSITFINKQKPKRSKESPYFGFTIAGCNKEEQCKWLAAMIFGQYSIADLLPKVNLMCD